MFPHSTAVRFSCRGGGGGGGSLLSALCSLLSSLFSPGGAAAEGGAASRRRDGALLGVRGRRARYAAALHATAGGHREPRRVHGDAARRGRRRGPTRRCEGAQCHSVLPSLWGSSVQTRTVRGSMTFCAASQAPRTRRATRRARTSTAGTGVWCCRSPSRPVIHKLFMCHFWFDQAFRNAQASALCFVQRGRGAFIHAWAVRHVY